MDPAIRVKLFGLIPVQKRTYLIVQGLGFVFLAAVVIVTFMVPPRQLLSFFGKQNPSELQLRIVGLLPWVFLATMLGEALETYLGLRRFAQKEALQKTTFFSN